MFSKCLIFLLIVQQNLSHVLTYLTIPPHPHPMFEQGKLFVLSGGLQQFLPSRVEAMVQYTCIPEGLPSR